jgi:hypothetical protein
MQIEAGETQCPACGGADLEFVGVMHHLICAYVGPEYDFAVIDAGLVCPKCRRQVGEKSEAEIVGTSARCRSCRAEIVVSPPPP